jgi:hypothetical protein
MIEQMTKRLTTTAADMQDLQGTNADWQRSVEAAYGAAGDLRTVVEVVFPQESGIHLLQASLPRRQVWWAVLSALEPADVTDAETMRHNFLLLADDTLLRARFGAEKGRALKPLLHALSPRPLGKGQYDVLAALLDEEAETLKGWIARDGMLDAYKLREYLFPDMATMTAVLAEEAAG